MKKQIIWTLLILGLSCTTKTKGVIVHVSLADDNRSVRFTGLDPAIASEINRDAVPEIWQGLVPVYRMPADTDMKDYQTPLPGLYTLKDSAVVFTPDTPFVKNQVYFLRYYKFEGGYRMSDLITGKKKLGKTSYIDLIFKQ